MLCQRLPGLQCPQVGKLTEGLTQLRLMGHVVVAVALPSRVKLR